ncbi:uncharacterized protein YecT (DUF1311 family) [Palleronia aestuarii]|uniref:Uncharacterized protein YecT (DUF1311 family) n=1 Tax=Palleronia aestuarii TaxID=568105 RepID=A0A2W7NHF5_9RHOB|nr:lysozyme inhibitor LprI family protein [Palleronia aestuarii]PZX17647.1 uncharacterized protein YecT (DUF1311 family) [Palleronia aestuarii]
MKAVLPILAILAGPASAQESLPVLDLGRIEACFDAAPPESGLPACLGNAANACMEASSDGETTAGSANCVAAETGVWEALMNEEYRSTRSFLGDLDQDGAPAGARADALGSAQRTWLAFRDAECGLRYLRWQDGTIRSVIFASCMLDLTAERALALRDMRESSD